MLAGAPGLDDAGGAGGGVEIGRETAQARLPKRSPNQEPSINLVPSKKDNCLQELSFFSLCSIGVYSFRSRFHVYTNPVLRDCFAADTLHIPKC